MADRRQQKKELLQRMTEKTQIVEEAQPSKSEAEVKAVTKQNKKKKSKKAKKSAEPIAEEPVENKNAVTQEMRDQV